LGAIRHCPDHLVVLRRAPGERVEVVFNGPGELAWQAAGRRASNGQKPISIARLKALDAQVDEADRLDLVRPAPV